MSNIIKFIANNNEQHELLHLALQHKRNIGDGDTLTNNATSDTAKAKKQCQSTMIDSINNYNTTPVHQIPTLIDIPVNVSSSFVNMETENVKCKDKKIHGVPSDISLVNNYKTKQQQTSLLDNDINKHEMRNRKSNEATEKNTVDTCVDRKPMA